MKVLISVKAVLDPNIKLRIKYKGLNLDTDNIKTFMNPFDEVSIESILNLKKINENIEITSVIIGKSSDKIILQNTLAMGVDKSILIKTRIKLLDCLNIAKILKRLILLNKYDLIVFGKQSSDHENNQTGQILASLIGWHHVSNVFKIINLNKANKSLNLLKDTNVGWCNLNVNLPFVLITDLRISSVRYISLLDLIKAKKKYLIIKDLDKLNLNFKKKIKILKYNIFEVIRSKIFVTDLNLILNLIKSVK